VEVSVPESLRPEESRRFGSRAFARKLLENRGQTAPSGRHKRGIQRVEATVVVGPPARVGRRRLLPFGMFLTGAQGTTPLYAPGPFDELRCVQRRVEGRAHDLEFVTWQPPQDQGSEEFRAFGCFRLDEAEDLVDLRRQQGFWLRMRAERSVRTLPQARVRGRRKAHDGLPREGVLQIEPAMCSGVYTRSRQPDLESVDVVEIMRTRASGLERVAWMEEAFRSAAPEGIALHRYYLDRDLSLYLVRQTGMRKIVSCLVASESARAQGLLIYPQRRPITVAA
jgi:hypothetical protein